MRINISRYNPETDVKPVLRHYRVTDLPPDAMLLDVLKAIKAQDESLSFRHSCGEGICGADGIHVNGKNVLACITPIRGLREPIYISPLPRLQVIRDLVVDMEPFFAAYREVQPFLRADDPEPEVERRQSPAQQARMDGYYECVLCACCTSACRSFQPESGSFLGPAALLQSWRFLTDSRDTTEEQRLRNLLGPARLLSCRGTGECVQVCPRGLNPLRAIVSLRQSMLGLPNN